MLCTNLRSMKRSKKHDQQRLRHDLLPDLRWWQIFFILASVIIGEGIFSGTREVLEVSGPGGTLAALFIVGVIAICVMSCVSELVQLFPIPNAIPTYIGVFIDEDLGWVCGVAYWYTYTAVFVNLYYTAGLLTRDWQVQSIWRYIIFGISPFALLYINMLGVNVFGIVETIGGMLKILFILFVAFTMYALHSVSPASEEPTPLYDGVQANDQFVANSAVGILWAIPGLAFNFLGVESVAVTAFEARDIHSLRGPSNWIAIITLGLYAFTLIGQLLLYSWQEDTLPQLYGSDPNRLPKLSSSGKIVMAVVVTERAGFQKLADFINAGCIYCAFSTANTALYLASRTLYGLARDSPRRSPEDRFSKSLRKFSEVTDNTRVPALALFFSTTVLFWLPFVGEAKADVLELVFEILFLTASICCLIVWAALCISFIRFRSWYNHCRDDLHSVYRRYDRTLPFQKPRRHKVRQQQQHVDHPHEDENEVEGLAGYGAQTGFIILQPILAWVGFAGSFLTVFVFSTATTWNGILPGQKLAIAYTAPVSVFLVALPLRKLWMRKMHGRSESGWVRIGDPEQLMKTLDRLQCAIPEKEERDRRGLDEVLDSHPRLQVLEGPLRVLWRFLNLPQSSTTTSSTTHEVGVADGAAVADTTGLGEQGEAMEMHPMPEPAPLRSHDHDHLEPTAQPELQYGVAQ